MDVVPSRPWSPRPPPPPMAPIPSSVVPAPAGEVVVPPEDMDAPEPMILPLTGLFLLVVAWALGRRHSPIVGARLPLRREDG